MLGFKSGADPVPLGSELTPDVFELVIQWLYQKEVFEKDGDSFAGIDVTHDTMHYVNRSLFMVIIHDWWGHGK